MLGVERGAAREQHMARAQHIRRQQALHLAMRATAAGEPCAVGKGCLGVWTSASTEHGGSQPSVDGIAMGNDAQSLVTTGERGHQAVTTQVDPAVDIAVFHGIGWKTIGQRADYSIAIG
ncbi:MAG: hypothetical protein COC22_05660 [Flavobacteriaceae bacterium]|nr:MAG: hypothetical protein COC22_05660 [Flavobacteriaceae bacterium]